MILYLILTFIYFFKNKIYDGLGTSRYVKRIYTCAIVPGSSISKLPEIVALFQKEKKHNLPVAIIQNGTRTNEKVGIGTVDTILDVVKEQSLSNPAIIVLGEVVKHRATLLTIQQQSAVDLNTSLYG